MQSLVYPFAEDPHLAIRCRDAGLSGVVALVESLDDTLLRGLDVLASHGLELAAHLVVTRESAPSLEATRAELARRGMKIVEQTVTAPGLRPLAPDARIV